ncbi:MAG TPA: hypothetical protein VLL74_03190 [Methanoregula sp.]|nr:hypothetical protein [Methanoregula sp.]
MHRVWPLLLVAVVFTLSVPVAGAIGLTIDAMPQDPHIGDTVTLSGTITGINTIAVYLFVTGPGLDPRGATLDNLNIPTGRGLFTTAPVNMENGSWSYAWDTSVILGSLNPGDYTIHVVSSPVERMRFSEGESASVGLTFRPLPAANAEAPSDPALSVAACGITGILFLGAGLKRQ